MTQEDDESDNEETHDYNFLKDVEINMVSSQLDEVTVNLFANL